MRIFRHLTGLPDFIAGTSVAIGNFDGVHRGHQEVIKAAGSIAREQGMPWGVLTFEPHPKTFFGGKKLPFLLTPFYMKARYIENLGVDFLVVLEFNETLAQTPADEFVLDVLLGVFAAKHLVSGDDFVFGHKRRGTVEFLKAKSVELGFGCTSVGEVEDGGGAVISSTRIRELLRAAKPALAAQLLGHAFEIEGQVTTGEQRGRTIGFPTANIVVDHGIQPCLGGYAIQAAIEGSGGMVWHDGIANLGYRPTFDGDTCLLETHIFDFSEDIYGKILRVSLVDYIRPEQKFDSIEALKNQIDSDCGLARELLANRTTEFS